MGDVSERDGLPERKAGERRPRSFLTSNPFCSPLFIIFLFIICLSGCELFTGSQVDLFQIISDEVDWANAEKLTVRIDYPAIWGTSNPSQGSITPTMDIRKGYEFSVEFTPEMAYTLRAWMVFKTSDLDDLTDVGSWTENPILITDTSRIQSLGPDDVTLPAVVASGGTFNFTINTTDPVTLVPWCDTQPRITRTEPRNNPDGAPYSRATDIVIYFNGALNDKTVKFADAEGEDGIWITSRTGETVISNKDYGWFLKPEYAAVGGFFTVTMNTTILTPADSIMTVTVKGIRNAEGEPMDVAGYTFSWKTSAVANVHLTSYTATYVDNSGGIGVSWTQTGADTIVMYYRLNKGADTHFLTSTITETNPVLASNAVIPGVSALNDSGTREGGSISGIGEYTVFIDLYAQGIMESRTTFKIWNFPGMSVSNTSSAIEVDDITKLTQLTLNDASKQYVLVADIVISSAWTPIGSNSNPFKGKFYGNGRTITLNSGFNGDGDLGLFGYAEDATIRDFTLVYNNTGEINVAPGIDTSFYMYTTNYSNGVPSPATLQIDYKSLRVGGLAGHLKNSEVCNIITSGGTIKVKAKSISGSVTVPGMQLPPGISSLPDGGVLLGGIAGYVEGGAIKNCRAALSTKYTPDSQETLFGLISAVAGMAVGGSIDKVTITADVDVTVTNNIFGVAAGAVAISQNNTLTDITSTTGKVLFSGGSLISICGGIVGRSSMVTINRCSFLGNIEANSNVEVIIGGLVGQNETDSGGISNCWVQGNINLISNGSPNVGGFLGESKNIGTFTMENCFFNGGNITINGTGNYRPSIGGFAGNMGGNPTLNNCGALSGTLTVKVTGILRVGGFISYVDGNVSNSFSRMDIFVESTGTSACRIGGFAGMLNPGSAITRCFATGTVSVVTVSTNTPADEGNPGRPAVGGLVGGCQGNISNSYALGNVVLSDSGTYGPAAAGGLVGRVDGGSIRNCFSAGRVSSQYSHADSNGAYSGGIAGYSNGSYIIEKTAALGLSVTARGSTRKAGRILGNTATGLNYNYALNTMFIGEGDANSTATTQQSASPGLTGRDGQNADSSIFYDITFWKNTLGFSETISSVSTWDFSRVAKDGYPRLAWEK